MSDSINYNSYMPSTLKESSKYNEAGFQINRLHELWIQSEQKAKAGELEQWHWILDSVWRELRADIRRTDNQKYWLIKNEVLRKRCLKYRDNDRDNWYQALNERHEFLKLLQDEVGKGGVFSNGTDEDFD